MYTPNLHTYTRANTQITVAYRKNANDLNANEIRVWFDCRNKMTKFSLGCDDGFVVIDCVNWKYHPLTRFSHVRYFTVWKLAANEFATFALNQHQHWTFGLFVCVILRLILRERSTDATCTRTSEQGNVPFATDAPHTVRTVYVIAILMPGGKCCDDSCWSSTSTRMWIVSNCRWDGNG